MQRNRDGEQKYYRLFGRFSIAFVLLATLAHAQSFSEFKREQAAAYKQYKDERDNAFANYLKEQWEAYKKFVSPPLYEKPKPKTIPKTKPKPVKKAGPRIIVKTPPPPKILKPKLPSDVTVPKEQLPKAKKEPQELKEPTIMPPKKQPKPQIVRKKDVEFDFFGSALGFDIPKGLRSAKFYPNNQKGIANFFDAAASSDYEKLIADINDVRQSLRLNDWGVYILVDTIAHHTYKYEDEAQLFDWFILSKMGYAVKAGLANGRALSMYYSKKIIYATPNFRFGKKRYYLFSHRNKKNVSAVYTYKQDYPDATKPIDLSLRELPLFEPDYEQKEVDFSHLGKHYEVSYKYNKNLVHFFSTYPQADYATFFNAPVDDVTHATLVASLRRYINGKKASEAMNFVLNFVQTAFRYETDQQQFGKEKVMFVEETLFYPASDCEDRAILYSYLTKELFHVPVLGIKYPNHMATALYVPLDGDKIRIKGREFVVADPTYINATIGEAMPQYKGKMPQEFIYVTLK